MVVIMTAVAYFSLCMTIGGGGSGGAMAVAVQVTSRGAGVHGGHGGCSGGGSNDQHYIRHKSNKCGSC